MATAAKLRAQSSVQFLPENRSAALIYSQSAVCGSDHDDPGSLSPAAPPVPKAASSDDTGRSSELNFFQLQELQDAGHHVLLQSWPLEEI